MSKADRRLKYILKGREVLAIDTLDPKMLKIWSDQFNSQGRIIAKTEMFRRRDHIVVSTVFLGIDHNFSNVGLPVLFETLVMGDGIDEEMVRYRRIEDAEVGHESIVKKLIDKGYKLSPTRHREPTGVQESDFLAELRKIPR